MSSIREFNMTYDEVDELIAANYTHGPSNCVRPIFQILDTIPTDGWTEYFATPGGASGDAYVCLFKDLPEDMILL